MYTALNVFDNFFSLIGRNNVKHYRILIGIHTTASKMDSIHESFEYLDNSEDLSFNRSHSSMVNGYSDHKPDFDDANEIRQNLRSAMKGARQRIANLRLDLEEKCVSCNYYACNYFTFFVQYVI